MKPVGFYLLFRFKFTAKHPSGNVVEIWTEWMNYWTHKVYSNLNVAEEAVKYIKQSTFSDCEVEFKIKKLFIEE